MITRALIAATVAPFVLAGCATNVKPFDVGAPVAKRASKKDCRKNDPADSCLVNVFVNCSSSPCRIEVDREFVIVHEDAKPDIYWQITSATAAKYKFTDDDGVILSDDQDADQFKCKPVQTSEGRRYTCKDNHRNGSETIVFKYSIRIKDTTTSDVLGLDPWVINR